MNGTRSAPKAKSETKFTDLAQVLDLENGFTGKKEDIGDKIS